MDERPAMDKTPQDKPKVLLTPEETAEALGCGRSQVYALISEGHLRSVKIGRLRRIPVSEVHRYVDNLLADEAARAPIGVTA